MLSSVSFIHRFRKGLSRGHHSMYLPPVRDAPKPCRQMGSLLVALLHHLGFLCLLFLFYYFFSCKFLAPTNNYMQIQDKSTFPGDYVLYQNCNSLVEVNVSSKSWFLCENVGWNTTRWVILILREHSRQTLGSLRRAKRSTGCLHKLSVAVVKHGDQKDVGKKGFLWSYSSKELRVHHGITGSCESIILSCLIQTSW